ncbi:hypothetical protein OROGR_007793 [Orobanche gracilis]
MGSDSTQDTPPASIENASSGEVEGGESNNTDSLEVASSAKNPTRELQSAEEILNRVELDLACCSEKVVNLDILVMHVTSRENDFEAFVSEEKEEDAPEATARRALEFDLLYGFLESEIRELKGFLSDLQDEIVSSQELISSFKRVGYSLQKLDEKLQVCKDSLKQSFEQVSYIKMQAASFQSILLGSCGDENWRDNKELTCLENGGLSPSNSMIKMQTAEQQRDILRMLEKSLAKEMDLEKKLSESRQSEDDLKFRLQQEVCRMEEDAEEVWEKLFAAENSAEILLGISKELVGQIQMSQFSINGSTHREGELRSKLQDLTEQLKEKDFALEGSESSRTELVENVDSLEQINNDLELKNKELEVKATEAEKRAEIVELECKSLKESNMELCKDVNCLQTSIADGTERAGQLEKQLKETEHKLLHALASAEASQEKQTMLDCTIKDMENLIKTLKSKVLRAENQTESFEEKCIILSETNAELNEEINFLRCKVEHLETSLHQADEAKKEAAKDIRVRAKLITDLVSQLSVERERLHKQISSTKERKVAVKHLQRIKERSVTVLGSHDPKVKEVTFLKNDSKNGTSTKESNEGIMGSPTTSATLGTNEQRESSTTETKMADTETTSELNTVRNIDARQLKLKYVLFVIVLILAIPAFAVFSFHQSGIRT